MTILYVLNSGKAGGMENHVLILVEGMVEKGQKVFVWCPEGDRSSLYSQKGAFVFNKQIKHDLDLGYIWELQRFIRGNKVEVIHAHELKAVVNSLIAGFLSGVKVRVSHTHTPISSWKINALKKFLDVKLYALIVNNFSSKEIALTKSVSETKRKEGITKNKLVVIPNALDTAGLSLPPDKKVLFREEICKKYSIPQTDFIFGCMGRLTEEKGHEILIRAFKTFQNKGCHLIIAGGGKLEPQLRDLVKTLSLEYKVTITGVFPEEDKLKLYSAFNVFVFPSYAEGFGISLMEAMYLEIPIVCSDIEVLKEVGGDTATYFRTGSPEDLARQMEKLYEDMMQGHHPDLAKAKLKVESEYTKDSFVSNYLELYRSLL